MNRRRARKILRQENDPNAKPPGVDLVFEAEATLRSIPRGTGSSGDFEDEDRLLDRDRRKER